MGWNAFDSKTKPISHELAREASSAEQANELAVQADERMAQYLRPDSCLF